MGSVPLQKLPIIISLRILHTAKGIGPARDIRNFSTTSLTRETELSGLTPYSHCRPGMKEKTIALLEHSPRLHNGAHCAQYHGIRAQQPAQKLFRIVERSQWHIPCSSSNGASSNGASHNGKPLSTYTPYMYLTALKSSEFAQASEPCICCILSIQRPSVGPGLLLLKRTCHKDPLCMSRVCMMM